MVRRAVIDVGTNSVKLLVADLSENKVTPVLEESEQTRLGRGFYETHQLQPGPISETAHAVADFSAKAKKAGASSIRVIATSAARDAKNANDLIEAIRSQAGLNLEVISGAQEADWAFQGVIADAELAKHPLLILDIGGGSTEFILGERGHAEFRESFNLGTVRLLEKMPPQDPPGTTDLEHCRSWLKTFLRNEVAPHLTGPLRSCTERNIYLVGTGGTSTIMARIKSGMDDFDRDRIESTVLTISEVTSQVERLWAMPLHERQQVRGLPPKRADVILTGVAIYEAVMQQFGFSELRVSTRGLRFAAIKS